MSDISGTTPFPYGAYLSNPDDTNAANEAQFQTEYTDLTNLMGAAPQFLDTYVDQTQPISWWVGNQQWAANSMALAVGTASTTPVIALPLSSSAAGSGTSDQQFQDFAAGDYDSDLIGIVNAWAAAGFTNLVFRPGWEMNLEGPTYAGDTAQDQADWVAAFQHVYTVLHAAAAADGINVTVVWNPGVTNYSNAEATTNLYPGNAYVDAIGADVYSDIYPYSDSPGTTEIHDWATGQEDTSAAQFIANPVNREHYWSDPAATKWSLDGSGGHSQSLDSLIAFAEEQGKPFAIPETGAGNSDSGTDVSDDAAFPQWLSEQLTTAQAAGLQIDFVNIWDSNGGGNYQFSEPGDDKPNEAAAWAKYFGTETAPPQVLSALVTCFAAGTLIATANGDVAIEKLQPGDRVRTLEGKLEPVVWIGRRRLRPSVHPEPVRAHPICIRASAFGEGLPRRDLHVSPEHAIFVCGVLIPARCLVNGTSIVQVEVEEIAYFHIELARHEIVLAEGLPTESWLDTGSRSAFDNAPVVSLHADFGPDVADKAWGEQARCPLVTDGPLLEHVRAMLAERAATSRIHSQDVPNEIARTGLAGRRIPAATGYVLIQPVARRAACDPRLTRGSHGAEHFVGREWRCTGGEGVMTTGAGAEPNVLRFRAVAMTEAAEAA